MAGSSIKIEYKKLDQLIKILEWYSELSNKLNWKLVVELFVYKNQIQNLNKCKYTHF